MIAGFFLARILTITGGSSMAAMIFKLPMGARFGGSGASFPIRIFLPPSLVRRKWRHAAPTARVRRRSTRASSRD